MPVRLMVLSASAFFLAHCASSPDSEVSGKTPVVAEPMVTSTGELEELIKEVGEEMGDNEGKLDPTGIKSPGIPIEINKEVERWLRYFVQQDRERFQRFLLRGEYYRPLVEAKLTAMGAPKELYYLAMIESGFQNHAHSRASAVGMWQFIKGTGTRYGLTINKHVDERRDPTRSTLAAATYLQDLHNVFQSWFLAMAAYNAGESRIMGAIMRAKTRDFWELARRRALPTETMNYVPKFIAATVIGRHPEKFGFKLEVDDRIPNLSGITIPGRTRLEDVATTIGVPLKTINHLNPHLRTKLVPPHRAQYEIWIPKDYAEAASDRRDKLHTLARVSIPVPSEAPPVARKSTSQHAPYYIVKRGDTLTGIAMKHGMSIAQLRRQNALVSDRLLVGRRLTIKPAATPVASTAPQVAKRDVNSKKVYKVQRGDNLHKISAKFGLSIALLKRWNQLRRNRLYAGEILHLRPRR